MRHLSHRLEVRSAGRRTRNTQRHFPVKTEITGSRLFVVTHTVLKWTTAIANSAVVQHAGSTDSPFSFIVAVARRRIMRCAAKHAGAGQGHSRRYR